MISFGSHIPPRRPSIAIGAHKAAAKKAPPVPKMKGEGFRVSDIPLAIRALATLILGVAGISFWGGHQGEHAHLKSGIAPKNTSDTLFPVRNYTLENVRDAINKGVEVGDSAQPYRVDTIAVPKNISSKEKNIFEKVVVPFLTVPAITPEEVRSRVIKLEDNRQREISYENMDGDKKYYQVLVGDTILSDPKDKKYLVFKYFSDSK